MLYKPDLYSMLFACLPSPGGQVWELGFTQL
jgi:hypothetical protein